MQQSEQGQKGRREGQMMDGQRGDRQTSPLLGQNQLTEPKIKRIM